MTTNDLFNRTVLDQLSDGVYFVDCSRRITYWNTAAEQITGFSSAEVLGHCCHDNILMHVDDKGINLCIHGCPLIQAIKEGRPHVSEIYLHHKSGHRIPVAVRTIPVKNDEGKIIGAIEVFSDRSEKLASLERMHRLEHEALMDPLTGVGNRRYTESMMHSVIAEFQRHDWPFGLSFIDIDHFKQINDHHGHDIGDKVLKTVARTIGRTLRTYDYVGRWGGEEFVVITPNLKAESLREIAERMRALIASSHIDISPQSRIRVTASIGCTVSLAGDTGDSIIKRADDLMYASKQQGRNRVTLG